MAALVRTGISFAKNAIISTSTRAISTTVPLNLREIRERKEGSTVIVEGVSVPSPRTEILVRTDKLAANLTDENGKPPCYMCSLGLDVKHTDVMILSQFVRSDGCMLPRRITGLCRRQQKKIGKMVSMAQKAGLMINMTPSNCKGDPTKRKDHKKFNTYYDEKTIFWKRIPKPSDRFKR
ncbi:28S ribosomal protein S18a, mitochondrial [Pectinophora gossypiella]|uniref:28S ribosomal protein S18a, mitochondrial n=1 Tax=Pectinophora gossypiella TaxID=13191 RepID=UPI00214ECDD6|nr:28S ribosomal protein S18a, mitochondrial [Pectinophora gossypiella]